MRFEPPEGATEEQIEAQLDLLREDVRERVRNLRLQGAGEDEINEYLASFDRADEEAFQPDDFEPREEEPAPQGQEPEPAEEEPDIP